MEYEICCVAVAGSPVGTKWGFSVLANINKLEQWNFNGVFLLPADNIFRRLLKKKTSISTADQ